MSRNSTLSTTHRIVISVIALAVMCVSFLYADGISGIGGIKERQIEYLERKQLDAYKVTTECAVASTVIAAVPDDSTTPIANQIASMSDYMIIASVALKSEKLLLTASGDILFRAGIPLICLMIIACALTGRYFYKRCAVGIMVFAAALYLAVPASIVISREVDKTVSFTSVMEGLQISGEAGAEATASQDASWYEKIYSKVNSAVASVKDKIPRLLEYAQTLLKELMDATSCFIVTTAVIPVCAFLLLKYIFGKCVDYIFTDRRRENRGEYED